MNNAIDLSKLSPKQRKEIASTIYEKAQGLYCNLMIDINMYQPGQAKDEMLEWASAVKDVANKSYKILQSC